MIESIKIYTRDNDVMDKDDWDKSLLEDLGKEQADVSKKWGNHFNDEFIYGYLDSYGFVVLNGHKYLIKTSHIYDTVEELRDDLLRESLCSGDHEIIDELLEKLTKEELLTLFSKSDKLCFENGKIIRKEK